MFESYRKFETTLAGRPLVVKPARWHSCRAAPASCATATRWCCATSPCRTSRATAWIFSRCRWIMRKAVRGRARFPARSSAVRAVRAKGHSDLTGHRPPDPSAVSEGYAQRRVAGVHRDVGGSRLCAGNHRDDWRVHRHFDLPDSVGRPDFRRRCGSGGRRKYVINPTAEQEKRSRYACHRGLHRRPRGDDRGGCQRSGRRHHVRRHHGGPCCQSGDRGISSGVSRPKSARKRCRLPE